jgi:hypothetical protein
MWGGSGFVSSLSAAFKRVSIGCDSFAVNAMSGFNSERVGFEVRFQKGAFTLAPSEHLDQSVSRKVRGVK